jgi:NAD(P)H-dependent flavin oxidoreductase YrpB (nitropropane dioxygenase family)
MKIKLLVELFTLSVMGQYADFCGWALARAHARAGQPALIAGYLGKGDQFDEAVADFATAYAEQNEHDYQAMLSAVRQGRIKVYTES